MISELQISGEQDEKQEFVELYNPNNSELGLNDWYLQRKTEKGSDYSSFAPNTLFSGKKIGAKDYFVIARQDSSFVALADIVIDYPLTENNTLVLKNPNREIVDKVGWGQAQDFEAAPAENPLSGQSIGRKWIGDVYQDSDNNEDDFEAQEATPKAENKPFVSPLAALTPPILDVSPESIEFSIIESATSSGAEIFTISNKGEGSFEWQAIINYATSSDVNWLEIEPSSGQISDETLDVLISLNQGVSGLANGNYEAEIIITAQGAKDSPQSVGVNLDVEPAEEEEEEEEKGAKLPEFELSSQRIIINEIAWMGTRASSTDEWIELFNPHEEPVELGDWQLLFYPKGETEPRTITFSVLNAATPTIDGLSYFLLERTSDETISNIKADYVFKLQHGLNNEAGVLELRDADSNLIDRIDCPNGWFAGDNDTKQTMERISPELAGSDPNNWANNNLIMRQGVDAGGNKIWGTPGNENSILISPTEISEKLPFDEFNEISLAPLNSPYIIRGDLEVSENKTLIIEPGVVLKFYDNYSGIIVDGTLKAIGGEAEEEKIIFTIADFGYVRWEKIYFREKSKDSILENIILRNAGGGYGTPCSGDMAGIRVELSSLILKNSIVENCQYAGIVLIDSNSLIDNVQFLNNPACKGYGYSYGGTGLAVSSGSPVVKNSVFKGNPTGLSIANGSLVQVENNLFEENGDAVGLRESYPFFSNNIAENNEINGILVFGSPPYIRENTKWQADLPYVVRGNLNVFEDVVFELEPGTKVEFYDTHSGLDIQGTLRAIGTEDEKIIFTSFKENPFPGRWNKIYFREKSKESILDNVILKYAGGGYGTPCSPDMAGIRAEAASLSIKNSLFEQNQYSGIDFIDSLFTIENSKFINNPACKGYGYEYGGTGLSIMETATPNQESFVENTVFKKNVIGISISKAVVHLKDLIFGTGDEANQKCNIFKDGQCINP